MFRTDLSFLHDHLVGRDVGSVNLIGRIRVRRLNLGITVWRVVLVVFETVEVLVAFPTGIAAIWLMFFHAQSTRVRVMGFGIDDRKGAIIVVFEGLGIVPMLIAISRGQCTERLEYLRSYDISSHFGFCTPFHIQ